jgi:hypothetical protein
MNSAHFPLNSHCTIKSKSVLKNANSSVTPENRTHNYRINILMEFGPRFWILTHIYVCTHSKSSFIRQLIYR